MHTTYYSITCTSLCNPISTGDIEYDDDEKEKKEEGDGRGSDKERKRKSDCNIERMVNGTMSRAQATKVAAGVIAHCNLDQLAKNSKAVAKGIVKKLSPTDVDVKKHGNDKHGLSFELKLSKFRFVCEKILKAKRHKHANRKDGYAAWETTLRDKLKTLGYKMVVPGVTLTSNGNTPRDWKEKMEGKMVKFIMTKEIHYLKKEDLEKKK